MNPYLDKNLPPWQRAKDLLSKLNVEEKMAQTCSIYPITLLGIPGKKEEAKKACAYGIGTVYTIEMRSLKTLADAVQYQHEMQTMIMAQSPHHIPAIFHMEGLCGGFIPESTSFPSGIGRGSTWDPELEQKIGTIISRQEKAIGVTQILAPVLDISRDSRMGRQGESYGEDPTLASAMGVAYAKGIQEDSRNDGLRADAVAKHFLGFHNSMGGIHAADNQTPTRLLREIYGKPFQAAIVEANLQGIMPCYCSWDGEATSTSKRLLTDLLRTEMGFNGLTVADYTGIANAHNVQGLFESLTDTGLAAMKAGMDMEWPKRACYNEELTERFKNGMADIQILDNIVERILTAKFRMGLFENPYALPIDDIEKAFHRATDEKVTLQAAEESIVLLKNDGILPLKKNIKKIAVIGCHAKNARYFFGGYTHISMLESMYAMASSIAGIDETGNYIMKDYQRIPGTQIQSDESVLFDSILPLLKPTCKTLYDELQNQLPQIKLIYAYGYPNSGNDTSHFEQALAAIRDADLCILTLGGKYSSSSIATTGEGVDAANINLPECQDAFITQASSIGKPMIGVHLDGRPISSDIADENLHAILEAWNPTEMGAKAIVNVLTGKVNPSGKLPVSVAYHAGQIPIFYNHPNGSSYHQGASIGFPHYADLVHTPRYFFGHGLSYTSFAYSDLKVNKKTVEPFDNINISCVVTNTGFVQGTETVQLYLKDRFASMLRPCMELQGFAKVDLLPAESKTVIFSISPSQLAFLDLDDHWVIEKGEIDILIGSSAKDIRGKTSFQISTSAFVDGNRRRFYAKATVKKHSS